MAAPSAAVATLAEHRGQVDDQDENCLTTRYGLGKQPGSGFERSTAAAERVGSMNDGSSVHSCVPPSLAWPAWQLYWQRQTRSSSAFPRHVPRRCLAAPQPRVGSMTDSGRVPAAPQRAVVSHLRSMVISRRSPSGSSARRCTARPVRRRSARNQIDFHDDFRTIVRKSGEPDGWPDYKRSPSIASGYAAAGALTSGQLPGSRCARHRGIVFEARLGAESR
jgi:hypothetical protein